MRIWLVLLMLPLAGCLNDVGNDVDEGADDTPSAPDVACKNEIMPGPVSERTADLEDAVAAWRAGNTSANLQSLDPYSQGGVAEMDIMGDNLYIDRGNTVNIVQWSYNNGTIVYDEIGGFTNSNGVLDVKVTDDQKWAIVGEDSEGSTEQTAGSSPFTGGLYVYDIEDPANPQMVEFQQVGPRRGPHMVFYHETCDGDHLVFGANADVSIHRFDNQTGALTELSRYQPNIVTEFNRDPEVADVLYGGLGWAHDMFVVEDDNKTLLVVANWDAGVRFVDITDPSNPNELGAWSDFPEGHEGNLHTVSMDWIGDRRIAVGAVEVGFAVVGGYHYVLDSPTSFVYVWDATDLANPTLIGTWQNPDEIPPGRDMMGEELQSTHNLQLEDGRIYLAHYGLGAYVLDISTPERQQDPLMVAFVDEPGMNVWDIVLSNGVIFTGGSTGVNAFHFPDDALVDWNDSRA